MPLKISFLCFFVCFFFGQENPVSEHFLCEFCKFSAKFLSHKRHDVSQSHSITQVSVGLLQLHKHLLHDKMAYTLKMVNGVPFNSKSATRNVHVTCLYRWLTLRFINNLCLWKLNCFCTVPESCNWFVVTAGSLGKRKHGQQATNGDYPNLMTSPVPGWETVSLNAWFV